MPIQGVTISMIAAVARNHVIGRDGDIPWYIPSDFKHFKRTTLGKPIVMGRKQFQSIGKPLPGRANIVVSRDQDFQPDGTLVFTALDHALEHAAHLAMADGEDELMVIGGGEIYRQAMDFADRLYISHVDLAPEGDVYFPKIDPQLWQEAEEWPIEPEERDAAPYKIKLYTRV